MECKSSLRGCEGQWPIELTYRMKQAVSISYSFKFYFIFHETEMLGHCWLYNNTEADKL